MEESSLKPILGSMAENTAMHGLPNIRRSVTVARRVFWSIIVLAGIVLILYEIVQATVKYYSYPVQTNISPLTAFSHPFPAVTICNQNPIRSSALQNAGSNIYMLLNDTSSEAGQKAYARTSLRDSILKYYSQLPSDTRLQIGHQLETILLDCSYGPTECNSSHFQTFNNFYYGNCFTYNNGFSQALVNATSVGPRYGWRISLIVAIFVALECTLGDIEFGVGSFTCLRPDTEYEAAETLRGSEMPVPAFQLNLYIEQNEYIGDMAEAAGVRVVIHNKTHMPFPEDEGFSASPGTLTYVGLTRKEISRAKHPYGDCQKKNHALNAYLNVLNSVDYSKMACKKTCLQYHIISNCGCGDATLQLDSPAFSVLTSEDILPCINQTQVDCSSDIWSKNENNQLNCSEGCSSQCFEVVHKTTLSYGQWPADSALGDVLNALNSSTTAATQMTGFGSDAAEDFLRLNTLKIAIYFESLDFDYVATSSSYSSSDLAASFGGQMGLWLGVSVCTLFEVVEMLWEMGLVISHKMNSRNNKTQNLDENTSDKKKSPDDQISTVKRDSWTHNH